MNSRNVLIASAFGLLGFGLAIATVAASPRPATEEVAVAAFGRYQAVACDRELYLVDTTTGETWVPNNVFGPNEWLPRIGPLSQAKQIAEE